MHGRGAAAARRLVWGRRFARLKKETGPAEGLRETGQAGLPTLKHRKFRWFGEIGIGVSTGLSLTRSKRVENGSTEGTGRTVTEASEHPMGVGATAGVRSRDTARAKTPRSSTG